MPTVDARLLAAKAQVLYEQRTFTPDEPRVWEWPVDVPAGEPSPVTRPSPSLLIVVIPTAESLVNIMISVS